MLPLFRLKLVRTSLSLSLYTRTGARTQARAKILISSLLQVPFMFALLSIKLMFLTSFM